MIGPCQSQYQFFSTEKKKVKHITPVSFVSIIIEVSCAAYHKDELITVQNTVCLVLSEIRNYQLSIPPYESMVNTVPCELHAIKKEK